VDNSPQNLPVHEVVYRQIREMILLGEFAPGQPVTIQGLVQELGVGMTPVREAIRRLTAEGALEFQGNRRIILPQMTLAQLDEIAFARLSIEPRLAYLATSRMSGMDYQGLYNTDQALNVAISQGNVADYLKYNYRFHHSLYQLSDAHILLSMSASLWLRIGPSLRVVLGRFGTASLPDKHQEALQAMRDGGPQAVAQAIREDLHQGHEAIRQSLEST